MKKNIAIIGSGFSSLAASCYLAQQGFEVTIYEWERNEVGHVCAHRYFRLHLCSVAQSGLPREVQRISEDRFSACAVSERCEDILAIGKAWWRIASDTFVREWCGK